MRFEANWRCYSTRYWGGAIGFLSMCAWVILYPLALGKSFNLFETAINDLFLRDVRITGLLLAICLYGQIICYLCSNTFTKLLIVNEDNVTFRLFNGKLFEFKYSDLSSLKFTDGLFEIFLFTFKDGREQKISSSVKNHKLAFETIQEKIAETQNK